MSVWGWSLPEPPPTAPSDLHFELKRKWGENPKIVQLCYNKIFMSVVAEQSRSWNSSSHCYVILFPLESKDPSVVEIQWRHVSNSSMKKRALKQNPPVHNFRDPFFSEWCHRMFWMLDTFCTGMVLNTMAIYTVFYVRLETCNLFPTHMRTLSIGKWEI